MNFEEMSKIDVSMQTEKKGKFSYLSWPYAVAEFRKACPNGTWRIKMYGENEQPYCTTESGCFVTVTVWPDASSETVEFTQVHPVLDYANKSVQKPNSFQVNTSIQRCLVKAIALATGIGLYIYAGEDLPPTEETPEQKAIKQEQKGTTADTGKFADETLKAYQKLIEDAPDRKTRDTIFKEQKENILADCGAKGLTEISKLKMTLNKLEA